ncbi:hypothetical protein C2E23DRAFT_247875 [Lenzites betulinus]|nr:hypothetical protein C2E23DRAFT_247875 [Lenzites betulinus]
MHATGVRARHEDSPCAARIRRLCTCILASPSALGPALTSVNTPRYAWRIPTHPDTFQHTPTPAHHSDASRAYPKVAARAPIPLASARAARHAEPQPWPHGRVVRHPRIHGRRLHRNSSGRRALGASVPCPKVLLVCSSLSSPSGRTAHRKERAGTITTTARILCGALALAPVLRAHLLAGVLDVARI